jgi:probable F420-dependent oxidoreductase
MNIGPFGIWTFAFDQLPNARAQELAAEVEGLGYGAIWVPEAVGKDPLVQSALLLSATSRITLATGIANIYARDAMAMAQGHKTLTEAFPDRFLLGLGVSHAPMVEGMRGHTYAKPVATMRAYLDAMDKALYFAAEPSVAPRRCIGALGPKMTALAAERTDGIHPYNVTPEHIAEARGIVGPDKLIAVEHAVVLSTDAETARAAGRAHLAMYLGLPNYTNNLLRLGFTADDVANGGSDRLIDALVAYGTLDQIVARLREHHAAGADHVCIQVVGTADLPAAWRELAPALAG